MEAGLTEFRVLPLLLAVLQLQQSILCCFYHQYVTNENKEKEHLGFIVSIWVAHASFAAGHVPATAGFIWHLIDPTTYSKKGDM